jgi:hypothetical protein
VDHKINRRRYRQLGYPRGVGPEAGLFIARLGGSEAQGLGKRQGVRSLWCVAYSTSMLWVRLNRQAGAFQDSFSIAAGEAGMGSNSGHGSGAAELVKDGGEGVSHSQHGALQGESKASRCCAYSRGKDIAEQGSVSDGHFHAADSVEPGGLTQL